MVTTRSMIRLNGFSRKTSFDGPSLNTNHGCSSTCPNRGKSQQTCDCDCENPRTLLRQQVMRHPQQRFHLQQNPPCYPLLLVPLQAKKNKKPLKHQQPRHIELPTNRPIYFPTPPLRPPPPNFRSTLSDSNSESDREGLEHFHRHLQQLHRLTCVSLEKAIDYGGRGGSKSPTRKSTTSKLKTTKSFSFKDIRDIGRKKKTNNNPIASESSQTGLSSTASSSSSSSPLSNHQSSSSSLSKLPLKRRNTTRTAKDYVGVSRIKLLAKYWNRGKSGTIDSGNGGSTSGSTSSSTTSSSVSDSGDSQISRSDAQAPALKCNASTCCSSKNNGAHPKHSSSGTRVSVPAGAASSSRGIAAPQRSHKRYPINQNNNNANGNTITYKVRYDIPNSWESEQLLSFASAAAPTESVPLSNKAGQDHQRQKHENRYKNKGASSFTCSIASSSNDSVLCDDHELLGGVNRKKNGQICIQCGLCPEVACASIGSVAPSMQNSLIADKNQIAQLSSQKLKKTHIFKNLTFTRAQTLKPKEFSSELNISVPSDANSSREIESTRNGKAKDKSVSSNKWNVNDTQLGGSLSTSAVNINTNNQSYLREKTMVQQKLAALGRSKSQKCPERRILPSPSFTKSPKQFPKLTHTNSVLVLSKNEAEINKYLFSTKSPTQFFPGASAFNLSPFECPSQPKVRFKEQQPRHHASDQCLTYARFQHPSLEKNSSENFRLLQKKVDRRESSSSSLAAVASLPSSSSSSDKLVSTSKMLPDERNCPPVFGCRIPRPKVRGIVPTHSYGLGSSIGSGPSSPVSRCSSAIGENRVRRHAGDFVEFTEISLQDDDSETSGFESEQNNIATTITASAPTIYKDDMNEGDPSYRRKQLPQQRNIPADMTPAGKYFTDFRSLYHYQEQKLSVQKSPTPSRGLSFKKPQLPALLTKSGKKKGIEESNSIEFLKTLPIFRKLHDGFFSKLSDHIVEVRFDCGTYPIRQGEKGDVMFFLVSGVAKATFKSLEAGKSDELFLKTLHPGDFFGEKAFQTRNCQYTYNVIATSEDGITCVKLDREAYEELLFKCHDFKIRAVDRVRKNKLPDEIAKIKLSDLTIVTTLGVGGFGRVELVTLISDSSRAFALKKMKKCQIVSTRQIEHIRSEKSILLETNCDFICKMYKTFKDSKYLYMLMECCLGGELWTVLRDRGRFDDDTAKFYIGCVIEALKYLHSRNIIYRDLKPENLLLDSSGYCKLVDFGFAKKLDGRKTWTFCGTPEYCAPEVILNKGHDLSADFWSLGVLMYELLTGTPPFTGGDPLRTYKIILQGIDAIEFPVAVSKHAVHLIRKLCRDNPADRLGAQRGRISDIKKHKWFEGFDWYGLRERSITPPIIPDVRGPLDFGNFDEYPPDRSSSPPEDISGWDWDF